MQTAQSIVINLNFAAPAVATTVTDAAPKCEKRWKSHGGKWGSKLGHGKKHGHCHGKKFHAHKKAWKMGRRGRWAGSELGMDKKSRKMEKMKAFFSENLDETRATAYLAEAEKLMSEDIARPWKIAKLPLRFEGNGAAVKQFLSEKRSRKFSPKAFECSPAPCTTPAAITATDASISVPAASEASEAIICAKSLERASSISAPVASTLSVELKNKKLKMKKVFLENGVEESRLGAYLAEGEKLLAEDIAGPGRIGRLLVRMKGDGFAVMKFLSEKREKKEKKGCGKKMEELEGKYGAVAEKLVALGFTDKKRVLKLLNKFDGDIARVVKKLSKH